MKATEALASEMQSKQVYVVTQQQTETSKNRVNEDYVSTDKTRPILIDSIEVTQNKMEKKKKGSNGRRYGSMGVPIIRWQWRFVNPHVDPRSNHIKGFVDQDHQGQ